MTSHTVSRAFLTCDGCGKETELAVDAIRARLQAARDGWKYGTKPNPRIPGKRGGAHDSPKDYCPDCPVPDDELGPAR